ncbi:FtsX-like permease family protein [Micromonospora sp. 4G57]|uniref:FtsX-like permease family protein n=1 Tax=Micromonospora sicca TaxID=2202420 RepID=A0ABU5JDG8_9ACTN|nr:MULTISPECIES: FtsX-like permease family protein [unclassified Micromonospora]MDZ5442616.1 FtsX-like permease family protein [Micromonospora sp. 4G57]MDZ5490632.1 FtsX-like permease family protein [Micromonospora sp. 4G53]
MSRGRFAGAVGSWLVALRIARREARRARGRTALVLAMITLPVLVLSFTAVSWDMAELTRAEQLDRRLGGADAELRWSAENALVQDAWGESSWPAQGESVPRTRPVAAAEISALLPAGSRVSRVRWWVPFEVRIDDRNVSFDARSLDLTDPVARPLARLRAGRPPAEPTEIAVSQRALRRLEVPLGGTVRTADGGGPYRVVGVVEFPDNLREVVAVRPEAPAGPVGPADESWLVDVPGRLDPALVDRLNARGVTVTARTAVPGRDDAAGDGTPLPDAADTGNAVLVGGLGLLEVVLLVGPAFAVGVRRRRRDLALVAVAGGDHVHLRRVVLADGVVLGAGGAALGLLLGTAAAFAGRPLVEQYVTAARSGGYRVFPAALAAIGAVAVLAGVLAALAPAWAAAREDVVAGLAGRRTPPRHRRRWLVVGVLLTLGGAAVAGLGAASTTPTVILAGLILGELGLVFGTPTLIGLLAGAGRLLPLAPRLALRDASRNRSSAAPAISAVMAAVAGSVALGVYVASDEARARADWQPGIPPGNVLLLRSDSGAAELPPAAQVAERVRAVLPDGTVARVDVPACAAPTSPEDYCNVAAVVPPDRECPYELTGYLTADGRRRALADPRCARPSRSPDGLYLPALVDDGSALPVLTGAPAAEVAAATRVLRAGGVVVNDPRQVVDGRVAVTASRSSAGQDPPATVTATLPGYALRGGLPVDRLFLSAAAAARIGLTGEQLGYAVDTTGPPTVAQQERLVADLPRLASLQVQVEQDHPYSDRRPLLLLLAVGAGVITLGAAGVATGLAAAEGRRDLSTLAAVGASPRVRRVLSLCQAGVIAVLGSALGIVAGLGSALIILSSVNRRYAAAWPVETPYPVVVPWLTLGVLVVVPLLAMLGAGLMTRSRLPVERRLE